MANTTEHAADFEAYLAERSLTPTEYQALPDEMRQYIWETWQWEHHIIPPLQAVTEEQSEAEAPPTPILVEQRRVPPPVSSPPTTWNALPVVALAVVLLVVTISAFVLRTRTRATAAPPGVTATGPLPAEAPLTVPGPGPSLSGWQIVGRAESQPSATVPFTITGPKWRIVWMSRAADQGPGDFALTIKRPDGRVVDQAVHTVGEGEGQVVLRGAGAYTLEIKAGEPYQVKVFDFH